MYIHKYVTVKAISHVLMLDTQSRSKFLNHATRLQKIKNENHRGKNAIPIRILNFRLSTMATGGGKDPVDEISDVLAGVHLDIMDEEDNYVYVSYS